MSEYKPNSEQQAFMDDVRTGRGSTILSSRAGTGKTRTIIESLGLLPEQSRRETVLVAFNSDIAAVLKKKAPSRVEVKTMHALGLKACGKAFDQIDVEKERGQRIAAEVGGSDKDSSKRDWCFALKKVTSMCKNVLAYDDRSIERVIDMLQPEHPERPKEVLKCDGCGRMEPFLEGYVKEGGNDCGHGDCKGKLSQQEHDPRPEFILQVRRCLDRATFDMWPSMIEGEPDEKGHPRTVDFDDMCYLPVRMHLKMQKYPFVFCDECLPGPTPVLLADGTSRTIQDLVESRYAGDVLAYDTKTKQQRACRVTGWQTVLNQKPLVKIKVRWTARKGTNRPTNFVICTVDHKVWANGRWIQAGQVTPGMVMQVETSAEKSQVGKITARGRVSLAGEARKKNDDGRMGGHTSPGFAGTRGGNGKGPTVPEQALMAELGEGWVYQHSIPTRKPRGRGYPTVYKVDLAKPGCKVAVEVDGSSHNGRRAFDVKKDKFLSSLGWTVIRVPNKRAVQNAREEAVAILGVTNCPVDAVVESVEPVTIPNFHVYDLTVEGLHCFYANGVLVHNCQDLNPVQHYLVIGSLARGGRFFGVGDPYQGIYRFRGANADSLDNLRREVEAKELKMTMTYRCGKAIVREAQKLVPDFQAGPDQHEGEVIERVTHARMMKEARPGDFILSRVNAPLLGLCLGFLREGRRANIRGKDIGAKLNAIVRKAKATSIEGLREWVKEWQERESERHASRGEGDDIVRDTRACLEVMMDGCRDVFTVQSNISRMFDDEDDASRITLSSTHRAKGMERERVWLLRDTYRPQMGDEERNLLYVGITRAIQTLFMVQGKAEAA